MQGREYLELAREIAQGGTEKHWRGTAGKAYYALFLEAREVLARWGFVSARHENVHHFVKARYSYPSDADLKRIGQTLERLGLLRTKADYDLTTLPVFRSDKEARSAIDRADVAIKLLDAIETDPARLAAAVAAIKASFP
ncbi:MAG: HEPN domain-containing protein [Planctomycetes bacterium]|nr:HEPN domain-containing protein [Planctomycetota bacterium]